jgi:hypothetical protein
MKFHVVKAELFHADGHIDMTKLIVVVVFFFRKYASAPET